MQPLTVVLVHGAFADGSGWNGVIERLLGERFAGDCPGEPASWHFDRLGLHRRRAEECSWARPRRRALLWRCSYHQRCYPPDNVVGLVYVAAFAPNEGERLVDAESVSKDSVLNSRWSRFSIRSDKDPRRQWSS